MAVEFIRYIPKEILPGRYNLPRGMTGALTSRGLLLFRGSKDKTKKRLELDKEWLLNHLGGKKGRVNPLKRAFEGFSKQFRAIVEGGVLQESPKVITRSVLGYRNNPSSRFRTYVGSHNPSRIIITVPHAVQDPTPTHHTDLAAKELARLIWKQVR